MAVSNTDDAAPASFADSPAGRMSPINRLVAQVAIMSATILVVLDQTIAAVALPHMQTALGATSDTVTWVLTSYMLASAVATPVTGWLAGRIGRRRLFIAAIFGFTLSSMACGIAVSLPMMVAARLVQGFFGAFLLPMSQSLVYDMNPPSKQMRAVTIWGLGAMVGPIAGPVVGGYLTEALNWRWVFFVNVPIGIAAVGCIMFSLPDFPTARRPFDHMGFALLAIALCALQLGLDRGTGQDWFESPEILIEFGICIAATWLLLFHLPRSPHPIISMQLFKNHNFSLTMLMSFVMLPLITAVSALLPPLFVTLMGYPTATAGELMIPRGVATMLGLIVGGNLSKRMDGRYPIFAGMLVVAYSLKLQTDFNLGMDSWLLILSGLLQGFGAGMAMTVLSYAAMSTAPANMRTEAAAVFSLMRAVGGSITIAIFSALLARNAQVNHAEIGERFDGRTMSGMMSLLVPGMDGTEAVARMADAEVSRQAMMIAYVDDFWVMMWMILLMTPLVLLLRPIRAARSDGPAPVHE